MCTVSFLPLAHGGYLLATNRDESPRRGPADPPRVLAAGGQTLLAPVDTDAGGTWVAVDEHGRTLCILNGDRTPAVPPAPDAPSRGRLVLDLMSDPSGPAVAARLGERARDGTLREKPFKLLVAEPGRAGDAARLTRLDWNGRELTREAVEGPALAVSSTFATDAVTDARASLFEELRADADRLAGDVGSLRALQERWHTSHTEPAPEGDAFSVCMHRPDAHSVSCTLVTVTDDEVVMDYRPGQPCAGAPWESATLGRVADARS